MKLDTDFPTFNGAFYQASLNLIKDTEVIPAIVENFDFAM